MIKLRQPNSKFYRWWNSYTGRRIVSATYSLGAAVVIMGAMFKILHLPGGNIMLGIGLSVESFIFALGIFDKPFREYDWSKIFNFKAETDQRLDLNSISNAVQGGVQTAFVQPAAGIGEGENVGVGFAGGYPQMHGYGGEVQHSGGGTAIDFGGSLSVEDLERLTEGIRNLTLTAENMQKLADVALAANTFAERIESASEMAASFADTQQRLNNTAETLAGSYNQVNSEMDSVVSSTRSYSGNIEGMSEHISSINSVYEMQLKQLQEQVDAIRRATTQVDSVAGDMDKMKEAASAAQHESQRYQAATRRLTQQVEDLNAIYGNMLNALS